MEAKKLDKLANNVGQLFMLRVLIPREEEQTEIDLTMPLHIQSLTEEYHKLFTDPQGLPQSRGLFDHKTPWQ